MGENLLLKIRVHNGNWGGNSTENGLVRVIGKLKFN